MSECDSVAPEIVELLENISVLLDGAGMIADIAHMVIEYVRPYHDTPRSLMNHAFTIDTTIRFIVDGTFGVSMDILVSHWNIECTRAYQYFWIEWSAAIGEYFNRYNADRMEFSDIWRYAVIGLDISHIPVGEILPSYYKSGHVPDGYDITCLTPGFRELVRQIINQIWFGEENARRLESEDE